ncbi:CopD family protein [Pseudomonas sp. NPDC007930]|uniref:CopD family protein n=1 Tax=Pseudomonas sp. NPDC007930 TaxID=3364417 RepID=UPI0036E06DFC
MTLQTIIYAVHVLAAMLWVGGMFFAWAVLRPASAAALPAPARLGLWLQVLQRFFAWVWGAVVVLAVSGVIVLQARFTGFETAPRYVQWMMGGYLVMVAVFIRLATLRLPALRLAVAAEDWPAAGAQMAQVRRWVGFNLALGTLVVALAALRPY